MRELLAHLTGDYVVQTNHMATEKTRSLAVAALHAATYTTCFLPLTRDPRRLAVIGVTHLAIDHWRLVRPFIWAKNQLAPRHARPDPAMRDEALRTTGYGSDVPDYLAVWLMIVTDNTLHLVINHVALHWRRGQSPVA